MARQLLIPLLCAATAAAKPVKPRAEAGFKIFAYGDGLGGHPVVEMNGTAHIIGTAVPDSSQNVTFVSNDKEGKLEAHVGGSAASELLAVPRRPGPVGFARDASDASVETTGFGWYDSFLYVDGPNHTMRMDWFARPVAGAKHTWELAWQLDGDGAVPVSLRNEGPSN